jgi:hypothetical protein
MESLPRRILPDAKTISIFLNFRLKAALTTTDKYLLFHVKWAEALYEKLK